MNAQAELFEPQFAEAGQLALMHLRRASAFKRAAEVFASRDWDALAEQHKQRAMAHEQEAECLAMYAKFGELAKLYPVG